MLQYSDLPVSVGGIMVSIAAFQAVDPGSIPGQRSSRFDILKKKLFGKLSDI